MPDRNNAGQAHQPHLTTRSTFSHQRHEPRATAQERIAATAPKTTYGKYSNKLLPLTGNQFRRDDVSTNNGRTGVPVSDARVASNFHETADADDSPLSDAEPRKKLTSLSLLKARKKKSSRSGRIAETARETNLRTRQQGNVCIDGTSPPSTGSEEQTTREKQPRKPARSSKSNVPPKTTNARRSRLPLKELILVSGTEQDVSFKQPPKQAEVMLSADPISSSMQDASEGMDEVVTPLKRKAQVSLSTIRKRLRTPTSNHKIVRKIQGIHKTADLTTTGLQSRLFIGDGFGEADLLSIRRPSSGTKGSRKRPHPNALLQGMQALTLASGPLPDVQFEHYKSSQLELKGGDGPCSKAENEAHLQESEAHVTPGSPTRNTQKSCKRQVSFSDNVDHFIAAQLSSVSAPRREPSVSLTDEDEGDEGDAESEDDAAADTYLAEDESQSEDDEASSNHDTEASPEPTSPSNQSPYFPDFSGLAERHMNNAGVTLDFRRPRTPGFHPYPSLSKRRLNEVNETIFDDYQIDDMLLEDTARQRSSNVGSNASVVNISKSEAFFEIQPNKYPTPIPHLPPRNERTKLSIAPIVQPRSILKNNIPQNSSENNQPESTAANTRRNSVVLLEESRYFSQAEGQLASSSPSRDKILRKKSNTRTYAPVQVPFSDEYVPETSPGKNSDHRDGAAAAARPPPHLLRRTSEAAWFSSTNQEPSLAKDLRDLTRSVSKENGTLSQSVRRRTGMPFRSPVVGR